MKVLDAVKKGFDVACKNLNLVLIVFGFSLAGYLILMQISPPMPTTPGAGITITPAVAIFRAVFFLLSVLLYGGIFSLVKDFIKEGKQELSKFIGYGKKFYVRLLGLLLILLLIIWIAAFLAVLIVSLTAAANNAVLTVVAGIIALVVGALGIYLEFLLFLSPYVLIVEDVDIISSCKRSIAFVRSNLMKVLGLGLLVGLIWIGSFFIVVLIGSIPQLVFNLGGKVFEIIMGILGVGVGSFLSVIVTASLMSYYSALRSTQTSG